MEFYSTSLRVEYLHKSLGTLLLRRLAYAPHSIFIDISMNSLMFIIYLGLWSRTTWYCRSNCHCSARPCVLTYAWQKEEQKKTKRQNWVFTVCRRSLGSFLSLKLTLAAFSVWIPCTRRSTSSSFLTRWLLYTSYLTSPNPSFLICRIRIMPICRVGMRIKSIVYEIICSTKGGNESNYMRCLE